MIDLFNYVGLCQDCFDVINLELDELNLLNIIWEQTKIPRGLAKMINKKCDMSKLNHANAALFAAGLIDVYCNFRKERMSNVLEVANQ